MADSENFLLTADEKELVDDVLAAAGQHARADLSTEATDEVTLRKMLVGLHEDQIAKCLSAISEQTRSLGELLDLPATEENFRSFVRLFRARQMGYQFLGIELTEEPIAAEEFLK